MTPLGLLPTRVIQLLVLLSSGTVLLIKSGMQTSLAFLLCVSLVGLGVTRRLTALSKEERLLALSLLAYPMAVLLGFAWHQRMIWPEWDAPSRFLLVIPVLLYLARVNVPVHEFYRWGCALGCIGAAGWALWSAGYGLGAFTDRASNSFVNPVPFACITLILAFSALPDRSQTRRSHILLWSCALLGLGAALTSQSRAVLLVIPLASFLYFLSYRPRGTTSARQWLWMAAGTLALSGLSAAFLKERIQVGVREVASNSSEFINSSMGTRLQLWHASNEVFLAHPLLGVGKGQFPQALKHMADQGIITRNAAAFRHSHSDLLFLLAETGLVGAASVLVVYLAFLAAFAKRITHPDSDTRSAAYAGVVTLTSYIAFGLADSMLTQSMQTAFLSLTLVLLFAHIRQRERAGEPDAHAPQPKRTMSDFESPTPYFRAGMPWLILSHCFNMDGRAASQVITSKIPLLIERGIVPMVISAPMGLRATTHPHIQAFSTGPSALRFDARHLISQRWGRGITYKLLTLLLSLLLAPLIVIERLLFGLQNHASWAVSAVVWGWCLIRQHQPVVIYSTGGAYSAHWAGYWLKRLTGVPWIAEVHDPMILSGQPLKDRNTRRLAKTEALICQHADQAWWLTQGALASALQRHPELAPRGFWVHSGASCPSPALSQHSAPRGEVFHIGHFGAISEHRSMAPFAQALGMLLQKHPDLLNKLVVDLFGSDLDTLGRGQAVQAGVADLFKFQGRLAHHAVFETMTQASLLLLIHGTTPGCSEYIPAKTFEYFWAQRPLLACTFKNPELDQLILERNGYVAEADDAAHIAQALEKAYLDWRDGNWRPGTTPPIDVESGMNKIFDRLAVSVPQALPPCP